MKDEEKKGGRVREEGENNTYRNSKENMCDQSNLHSYSIEYADVP